MRRKSVPAPPPIDAALVSPLSDALLAATLVVAFAGVLARFSGLLNSKTQVATRVVDAAFAGASVALSISVCHILDGYLPFRVYDSKMLSSAVIFLSNPSPPKLTSFLVCSACGFVVGIVLNIAGGGQLLGSVHTQSVSLGLLLFFWRISGSNFSSTVGLAVYLAQSGSASWAPALRYTLQPWLAGHALLYALAHAMALPRAWLRVRVAKHDFGLGLALRAGPMSAAERQAELHKTFANFDSSGDGRIDATELKVALRALLDTDLALADCEALIRSVDVDGNGTIDFGEFVALFESQSGVLETTGKQKDA